MGWKLRGIGIEFPMTFPGLMDEDAERANYENNLLRIINSVEVNPTIPYKIFSPDNTQVICLSQAIRLYIALNTPGLTTKDGQRIDELWCGVLTYIREHGGVVQEIEIDFTGDRLLGYEVGRDL